MARKRAPKVKVVRVNYGIFGNPNSGGIQRSIQKWTRKGYDLKQQNDVRGGCFRVGHTLLTFIENVAD